MNPAFQTLAVYLPFAKPPALSVPFDLLRAHNYPLAPHTIQRGVEEYHAAGGAEGNYVQPSYLPQRTGFRRHKTPPYNVGWSSAVSSPIRAEVAGNAFRDGMLERYGAGAHMLSPHQAAAARGALPLPQPSDNWQFDAYPYGQDIPPRQMPPYTQMDVGYRQSRGEEGNVVIYKTARAQRRAQEQAAVIMVSALIAAGR